MSLEEYFVRRIPDKGEYKTRLNREIEVVEKLGATDFFIEVSKVCTLLKDIPRTIRGSAGSSLLAWMLGINDIDPVEWNIPFERFMNSFRQDLPDIDLDFPHDERDRVFELLDKAYPDRIGRVVNHVQYHEKSALREALRMVGYKKRVPADFSISDLVPGEESTVYELASQLMGTVRSLDLHCGGAIIFNGSVPNSLKVPGTRNYIRYDKREVDAKKLWKLDMLSNRALSQLRDCGITDPDVVSVDDEGASQILSAGDSFGLTQAESPAFKKILRAIKPRNVRELALCLGLVRPAAAWRGHRALFIENWNANRQSHHLVFEDDANTAISLLAGVSLEEADAIRRAFAKQDFSKITKFKKKFESRPETASLIHDLESFKEFSMCESHAVAYAKITWALAHIKRRDPKLFWHSTLNNAISMYRPWVHYREALKAGLDIKMGSKPWMRNGDCLYNEGYTESLWNESPEYQYSKYGFWNSGNHYPGCGEDFSDEKVHIRGLIAIYRTVKYGNSPKTFITIGTDNGRYVDLVADGAYDLKKVNYINCVGTYQTRYGSEWVEVEEFR